LMLLLLLLLLFLLEVDIFCVIFVCFLRLPERLAMVL